MNSIPEAPAAREEFRLRRRTKTPALPGSAIPPRFSGPITLTPEYCSFLLLVEPAQEFLKPGVCQYRLDRVERIPQLIMTPGLVDEILAGMAGRHDFGPTFATRDYVMSARGNIPLTKNASHAHL